MLGHQMHKLVSNVALFCLTGGAWLLHLVEPLGQSNMSLASRLS